MIYIAFFIVFTKAIILRSLTKYSDFQIQTLDFECENIGLSENGNFYIQTLQEFNVIQKTSTNFEGLFNEKWNQTFLNLIYEQEYLPQSILILQTQNIQFQDQLHLCSLIQYKQNHDYQIYCTKEIKQLFIDGKIEFNLLYEFSFSIFYEENQLCHSFLFIINHFYIVCLNNDHLIIITLDMKGNQQIQKINISNPECKTKFTNSKDQYFIVSLYQCLQWEIIILDSQMQILKRITISEIRVEENDMNAYQYLQDIKYCQDQLLLNFQLNYIQIDLKNSFRDIKYKFLNQISNKQILHCQISLKLYQQSFSQQIQDIIISAASSINFKEAFLLENSIILLQYSDHLIAILASDIKQIINIEIHQIILLRDNIQFFIIDQQNKLSLYKTNIFQIQYSNQQNQNYVGFFKVKYFESSFLKCFQIHKYEDEQQRLQNEIKNFRNKNYLLKIDDTFDNKIFIEKLSFIQEKNINLNFSLPFEFQNKLQIENKDSCQSFGTKQSNLRQFYILKKKSKNYILFNDENLSLVIYNCISSRSVKYNIKIDLNSIQTYYYVDNLRFILIQETQGKIIIFDLSNQSDKQITYKIHQFKEQIRISCIFKNVLIIQLVNSTQVYFEFPEEARFMNFSIHQFSIFDNIFFQNFDEAIKVLILQNTIIFQFESYLLIQQSNLIYLIINKKLNLLGGFTQKSRSLQLILLAIDNEMNTIYKYLITKSNYYLISTFTFTDYFPIKPLHYQIQQNHFIIVTLQEDPTLYHLLLFNLLNQQNFNYYEIVSTPYKYFSIQQDILYYYNNQGLIEKQLRYFIFNFYLQELNQIFYYLEFKINISHSQLQNCNYQENLNLMLVNSQFNLKLINQNNLKIVIKNDQAIINPNQYALGQLNEIQLINNTAFTLQSPFKVTNRYKCQYLNNAICILNNSQSLQLYNLSSNIKLNKSINAEMLIQDETSIFSLNNGFVLVEQFQSDLVQISYFTEDSRNFNVMMGVLISAQLKESLLMVKTNYLINYYFIDELIHLISSNKFGEESNKTLSQIGNKQYCQTLFKYSEININCFSISQNIIQSVQNYTILTTDICNSITKPYQFLPKFQQQLSVEVLNLSQIQENELEFNFLLLYQNDLIFYFQIKLSSNVYHIKLHNIIRYPQFVHSCNSYILKQKLLIYCQNLQIFLFNIENEFQILNSYVIKNIPNEEIDILNNTHIALYEKRNKYVKIIELDNWKLIKNSDVSLNDQKFLTLFLQNKITQIEFKVEIITETKDEISQKIIDISVIAINNVFIILLIKIKKVNRR